MSSPKRMVLFFVLSFILMMGTNMIMDRLGLIPKPVPAEPAAKEAAAPEVAVTPPAKADAAAVKADPAKPAPAPPAAQAKAAKSEPPLAKDAELVLGASDNSDPAAYRLEVRFDQIGAGVRQLLSARYDGETPDGIPDRKSRLQLITDDRRTLAPKSFSITLQPTGRPTADGALPAGEVALDTVRWEVVRDKPDAPAVKSISKSLPDKTGQVEGQEITFRTTLDSPNLTITKRFRIWKGEDGFEFELNFAGDKDATVAYRLFGPHGIPIEGESYTANFRDVFFGQVKGDKTELVTRQAADVVKNKNDPERLQALPIKYTGIENQYFTVFLEPTPPPTPETRWDREALAFVAREDSKATQKSDVGVELSSVPLNVGPNRPVNHTYRVFAGAKTTTDLAPYAATELASYRKNQWFNIPFASSLAQNVIAPLLDRIYGLTKSVARMFGLKNGNYGIAIILLTMTVRMIMFPIGRKQAMISKKMQDLQPYLAEIKEKYKDDKERQTKETFALYKEHGFNPAAGCLPALIQLPIFVGLWQALNNSVALRHSQFLYIKNLAAPDMLFTFPTELPIVGKYFNLLPFLVVSLMLVQTKLFQPPAVTDEARMQQKMMKYMMVFMAFMFYKVPSGLGIYFITSSLWQVCERLLLPKVTKRKPVVEGDPGDGTGSAAKLLPPPKPAGWFAKKLESLLEQANNERTIRNNGASNGSTGRDSAPPERNRNRPRPGKRR
jgi:YidC/Oxa1 family membrane protein insertase